MWDAQKQQRFQHLRQRELQVELTETEQKELASLVLDIQSAEAASLGPATQRLRQEREILDTQNRALEVLARRKESLVRRLGDFLAEAQAEHKVIEGQLAAVLAGSQVSETTDG